MKFKIVAVISLLLLAFSPVASATSWSTINQDVTAYVAGSGAKTYHGTTPVQYYTVAVHPSVNGDPTSGTVWPYGAIITTDTALQLTPTESRSVFKVEDMGDVNMNHGFTWWWFDVYFGLNTATNISNAVSFGNQTVDYTVTY